MADDRGLGIISLRLAAGARFDWPGGVAAVGRLPLFALGWTLMTVAMMLPGSLPLVNLFRRLTAGRAGQGRLVGLLLSGYLAAWLLVGLMAFIGDLGLHTGVNALSGPRLLCIGARERLGCVSDAAVHAWVAIVITLAAGVYQFTPLKHRCLDQCRSPYSFLTSHWRGQQVGVDAVRLGLRHGWFCVGCCWTIMLLMWALAGVNLGWMLLLGGFMAAERSMRWGSRLTYPTGVVLLAWGGFQLATRMQ